MTRRAGLAWGMVILVVFAGCTSMRQKKWGKGTTNGALIGAAVGGGAGVGVSEGIGQDSGPELARGGAIGAAVGLIIGGLIGHYVYDEDIPPEAAPEAVAEAAPAPVEPAEIEAIGKVIAVIDVSRFGFNESAVPPSAYPQLDALVAQLQQRPTEQLVLEGHTDDIGSESYNYALGLRRAEAVRDYLATHGVARDRMAVRSEGKRVPVASNVTPEGRAKNRRVEVRSLGTPAGGGTAPPAEPAPAEPGAVAPQAAPAVLEPAAAAAEVPAAAAEVPAAAVEVPAAAAEVPAAAAEVPAAAVEVPAAAAAVPAESKPALLEPAPEVAPDRAGHATEVVYFTVESYDLSPRSVQVLDNVVAYFRSHPTAAVTLAGHNDGVVETNRSTSSLRSERVRMYLISRGIPPTRITTKSEGSNEPADTSGTPEGLAKNRRVELTIEGAQ